MRGVSKGTAESARLAKLKVEFTEVDRWVWRSRSQRSKELRVCRKSDLRMHCWLGVQREGGDGGLSTWPKRVQYN